MENQDLVKYQYQFIVTPLLITNKIQEQNNYLQTNENSQCRVGQTEQKNQPKKLLVVKLGKLSQKTFEVNHSMTFPVQVSFSKNLQKYHPINCLIKIYDIGDDKSQTISSVGTIPIQSILDSKIKRSTITKSIGHDLMKLEICARNMDEINRNKSKTVPHVGEGIVEKGESQGDEGFEEISSQNIMAISMGNIEGEEFVGKNEGEKLQGGKIAKGVPKTYSTPTQLLIDLKSAINFGVSKSKFNINHINITATSSNPSNFRNTSNSCAYSSNNKLINKMNQLRKSHAPEYINQKQNGGKFREEYHGRNREMDGGGGGGKKKVGENLEKGNEDVGGGKLESGNVGGNKDSYYKQSVADDDYQDEYNDDQNDMSIQIDTRSNKQFRQNTLPSISKLPEVINKQKLSTPPMVADSIFSNELQYGQCNTMAISAPQAQAKSDKKQKQKQKKEIEMVIEDEDDHTEKGGSSGENWSHGNTGKNKQTSNNLLAPVESKSIAIPNLCKNQIANSISLSQYEKSIDLSVGEMIKSIYNLANVINLPHVESVSSSCYVQPMNSINNGNTNRVSNEVNARANTQLTISNTSMTITSILSHPEYLHQQKLQLDILGEQLIEQRRKNIENEQKIEKLNLKLMANRQKYEKLKEEWNQWCMIGKKFIDKMIKNKNGQFIIQISNEKESISFKYESGKQNEDIFLKFLMITLQNCNNLQKVVQNRNTKTETQIQNQHQDKLQYDVNPQVNIFGANAPELTKIIDKIEETYQSNVKLSKLREQLQEKILALTAQLEMSQHGYQRMLQQNERVNEQNMRLGKQVEQLKIQISVLKNSNENLKEKQQEKQNLIENFKKKMQSNNNELDQLDDQIAQCKKNSDNKELIIDELKEEIADKEEIIEMYKNMYGEIKQYGNNRINDNQNKIVMKSKKTISCQSKKSQKSQPRSSGGSNSLEPLPSLEKITSLMNQSSSKTAERLSEKVSQVSRSSATESSQDKNSASNNSTQSHRRDLSHKKNTEQKIEKDSSKKTEYNDKNLLLSIIRNEEKMYKLKFNELIAVEKEINVIGKKINQYIKESESIGNLGKK